MANNCANTSMEIILMNTENCKTHETFAFISSLPQRLDWKKSGKHVALQNYYTSKNLRR